MSPIGRFALAPVAARGLVLGFGGVRPPQIDAGVDVLAQVLERHLTPARRVACGLSGMDLPVARPPAVAL